MTRMIDVSLSVRRAIEAGEAVVALESTIIAHGMSYPHNVETALEVEDIVRRFGAEPCTIALIGGKPKAGLAPSEIEYIGRSGTEIAKCSTRDLPYAIAKKLDAATTVASTVRLAANCGIRTFATGGIGGVHREAQSTFDISADLTELSQSNIAIVTAGAKAILDLELTLETLETLGVPVVGFGVDRFPAFYSRDSGLPLPLRADTVEEIAAMMDAKWSLGLTGGIVVANPIPASSEIPRCEIEPVIEEAIGAARAGEIKGKDLTPFLLAHVAKKTSGRSLAANIALVKNNAEIAAKIAVAYANRKAK